MQIYIHRNNQQLGPFTEAEIKAQLAAGTASPQDNVWWQGQEGWVPLEHSPLAEILLPRSAPTAPGRPPIPSAPEVPLAGGSAQATSGAAIWSLVCGCLSLLCGIFASIPAIILGHVALGAIKKNPELKGKGLAITGLILGYIMTVLVIVVICFYIAFLPTILKAIKAQQANGGQLFIPTLPANNSDQTSPDNSTNSSPATTTPDQSTNAPDQSAPAMTNSTPAAATPSDQSTNAAPAPVNAPTPATNAPPSTTNAAPMSQ